MYASAWFALPAIILRRSDARHLGSATMLKQKSLTAIVLLLSAPFGRPLLRRGSAPFSNGLPPGLFLFSIWEYFTAEEFQLPSDGPGFLPTSVPE